MNYIKNNPQIDQILNGFFKSSIGDIIGSDFVSNKPSVNITESEKTFNIHFAAPGFTKDQFKMELTQDHLHVSAEVEKKEATDTEKWNRREFDFGSFKRSFKLPQNVDRDAISANYEKGILNISIHKKEIDKSSRSIAVS